MKEILPFKFVYNSIFHFGPGQKCNRGIIGSLRGFVCTGRTRLDFNMKLKLYDILLYSCSFRLFCYQSWQPGGK